MNETLPIVFVVDDEATVGVSIKRLLQSVGLEARHFTSASEFLRAKRPDVPGCIVLDVRLPDLSGLDLQQELATANVDLPVIFITGHADIRMTVRAMKAGAVEFLTKPYRDQALLDAVLSAIEKDRHRRTEERAVAGIHERFEALTARERQVMALTISGQQTKQIAGEVGIQEVTVRVHRREIMRKMGAKSLADLVKMGEALRNRGVTLNPHN
jgi:FixJ family two-component response regulator